MPNSWLHLQQQNPDWLLGEDQSSLDEFHAKDCGWVEQMLPFIREFSAPDDIILDPFCGFASTLIAAQVEGRRAVGIEIEENRFEIARSRIENLGVSKVRVLKGDCRDLVKTIEPVGLIITNIPYFGCSIKSGMPQQIYSARYYVEYLSHIRERLKQFRFVLKPSAYIIFMVQNIRIGQLHIPQAWDVAKLLAERFQFIEERVIVYDKPIANVPDKRSNRAHEYALIAKNSPKLIDLELTVEIALEIQKEFPEVIVFGSITNWLDGALIQPSDLDIFLPFDPALIKRLLGWLGCQGFDISRWGRPCSYEAWDVMTDDTNYLHAERLDVQGRLLLIDISYSRDAGHYQQLAQNQISIKGINCSRHIVLFND